MLMSTQAIRYTHQLLDARAKGKLVTPLSGKKDLSEHDAYDIVKTMLEARIAHGEIMVGRKIGFTNSRIWSKYGIDRPIWTPMFDSTVVYTEDNRALFSLKRMPQPRIAPEIVFSLGRMPEPGASMEETAECIEWMAHALEILVCPFPQWEFEAVDAIAAYGLHGALIVGEPRSLSAATRRNLASVLADSSLSLSRGDELRAAGFGSDVMGSPVHALWHLHQLLQAQPHFTPLSSGEIVTTGTWADVSPVAPGDTWTTAFSGVSLPGLTVSFT